MTTYGSVIYLSRYIRPYIKGLYMCGFITEDRSFIMKKMGRYFNGHAINYKTKFTSTHHCN